MYKPSLEEVKTLASSHARVPISLEIMADTETTIGLLTRLERRADCCFLLESVEGGEKWGRYSFLGFGPATTVTARGGVATIIEKDGARTTCPDPIGTLRGLLKGGSPQIDGLPRFTGGIVGYFGYDIVRYFEDIPDENDDDAGFPDF